MFLSARSIAARRLAFSLAKDSAQARNSEMKRYSRTSAQRPHAAAYNLGQVSGRPADFGQTLLPLHVEGQQPLANRFVERPRQRPVMEYPKAGIVTFGPMRFAFDFNLPDERGDGLDRVRHGVEPDQRQPGIR